MIEINNLTISNKNTALISNLNIEFKQGEFWAILGKNGTGKTTLMHTIAGLLDYNSGSIKVNSRELSKIKPLERAQNIALLSQLMETGLDCTVEQSITYGRYPWNKLMLDTEQEKKCVDGAINKMQLSDLRHKSIKEISGGELRKVEIATILAQNSSVLMLDEPLNHLDLSFRYILMKLLKQLSDKKLIIMVTHDIQYVKAYCSHVLLLSTNGNSVHGTTKNTLKKDTINKILEINLPENVYL